MLKGIKTLLKANIIFIAALVTLIIAALSLIKIGKQPVNFAYLDKIEHAIAYFVLTLLWLIALGKTKKAVIIIVLLCIFYGIVIEVLQVTLTSYRMAEYLDALANSTGVLIALFVFQVFLRKKQSI